MAKKPHQMTPEEFANHPYAVFKTDYREGYSKEGTSDLAEYPGWAGTEHDLDMSNWQDDPGPDDDFGNASHWGTPSAAAERANDQYDAPSWATNHVHKPDDKRLNPKIHVRWHEPVADDFLKSGKLALVQDDTANTATKDLYSEDDPDDDLYGKRRVSSNGPLKEHNEYYKNDIEGAKIPYTQYSAENYPEATKSKAYNSNYDMLSAYLGDREMRSKTEITDADVKGPNPTSLAVRNRDQLKRHSDYVFKAINSGLAHEIPRETLKRYNEGTLDHHEYEDPRQVVIDAKYAFDDKLQDLDYTLPTMNIKSMRDDAFTETDPEKKRRKTEAIKNVVQHDIGEGLKAYDHSISTSLGLGKVSNAVDPERISRQFHEGDDHQEEPEHATLFDMPDQDNPKQ